MGTSNSNPGPTGRPPLLPPWAPSADGGDGADGDQGDQEAGDGEGPGNARPGDAVEVGAGDPGPGADPTPADTGVPPPGRPSWNSPRRLVGSMASGRAGGQHGRDNVRRAVQRSVGAMGGRRTAAQSAVAGRQTAGRFASFLAGMAAGGITAAARTLGIAEFLGRSTDVFLLHLADALAPSGALTEDAVARDAMDATLMELYQQLDIGTEGIAALERMTPAMMAGTLVQYVINYIYARVINALTAHIHATAPTISRIGEVERTARRYIEDVVRQDVDTSAFFGPNGASLAARWDASAGQRVINRLFEESYLVVEAGLARPARGAA